MAKLTLTEAARLTGKGRNTLYRAIRSGALSREPDGTIDTAELLRAGYTLMPPTADVEQQERSPDTSGTALASHGTVSLQALLDVLERERLGLARERDTLVQELATARERETQFLALLREEQQQRQRLLEAGASRRPGLWARIRAWGRGRRSAPAVP